MRRLSQSAHCGSRAALLPQTLWSDETCRWSLHHALPRSCKSTPGESPASSFSQRRRIDSPFTQHGRHAYRQGAKILDPIRPSASPTALVCNDTQGYFQRASEAFLTCLTLDVVDRSKKLL